MFKKLLAFILTLALICCGGYLLVRLNDTNAIKGPDNVDFKPQDNTSTVESITADTPTITVTKDPGEESVRIGGITWFIAHADNDDSIDWVFVKPNNAEFRRKDIEEEFPGFYVTLLTEDTVELANVPAELDGWQIKAKFTNADCTVYSKPATIHVVNYDVRYKSVISLYDAFLSGDESKREFVSELAWDNHDLGYSVIDLDHDGTEELLIGSMHPLDASFGGALFDVYTLVDDEPVRVLSSSPRARYYLRNDSLIYSVGSSGAGMSDCIIYEYYSAALHISESVWTNVTAEDPFGYFHTDEGDRSSEWSERITEAYFYDIVRQYEADINYLYPTTPLT